MPRADVEVSVGKLLKHLPEHGIVICKPCQFAIQPSALSSHLLRHQIYRNERRQFLELLKGLDLREPEHVTYPSANAAAMPELPVYRGWLCEVQTCGHACASEKRMAQHWSDQHGSREVVARTAWLQTFFKGNKIRYFEVSEPASAPTPVTDDDDEQSEPLVRPNNAEGLSSSITSAGSDSIISQDGSTNSHRTYSTKLTPTQLNTLNLQLMHHWSTSTSYTAGRGTEPPDFWTQIITGQALSGTNFLMYGCLSASAFHLASLEHKLTAKFYQYREIGLEYQGYAVADFRSALAAGSSPKEALLAFNRLLSITRCAEHHLDPDSTDSAINPELEGRSLPILECIMLVRGATNMWYAAQDELPDDSGLKLPHEVLVGLASIPYDGVAENVLSAPAERYPHIPAHLFRKLLSIPPKLTMALHYTTPVDLQAIKHAFASIITCFDHSFSGPEIWRKWNGVEAWPKMVSERFLTLIESCHPAAVVMLGLWALLVKRLEAHCWFLQGETRRLFRFVREPLDGELKDLIDDIAGFPV